MQSAIQHIGIIGSGNVAWSIGTELKSIGFTINCVYSRNPTSRLVLAKALGAESCVDPEDFSTCDLIICAVTDDAVLELVQTFAQYAPVISTSGTVNVMPLNTVHPVGVCYPLQSFSAQKTVDWKKVPLFIEAQNTALLRLLNEFALHLSEKVYELSAAQRINLHVAAVYFNNFTNHIIALGQEIVDQNGLNFEWFLPLIRETLQKLETQKAYDIQTGPARRNDKTTIERHLSTLSEKDKLIYQMLSDSIRSKYTL